MRVTKPTLLSCSNKKTGAGKIFLAETQVEVLQEKDFDCRVKLEPFAIFGFLLLSNFRCK